MIKNSYKDYSWRRYLWLPIIISALALIGYDPIIKPQSYWIVKAASVFIFVFCFMLMRIYKEKDNAQDNEHRIIKEYETKIKTIVGDYEKEIKKLVNNYEVKIGTYERINKDLLNTIKCETPFKNVAVMTADFETAVLEKEEKYLRFKPHPARTSADKIKEIRMLYNKSVEECKHMNYKYEFMLNIFPELREYLEDEKSLLHITEYLDYDSFDEQRDRVRDWISDDDYRLLSENERNQLALDKYKNRTKDNWEIGIDYELYIGYLLRSGKPPFNIKFTTIQYGEINGLNDLGRDIIAQTVSFNEGFKVYIIQCKRWATGKVIHENTICQLYGTTIVYQLENQFFNTKVIPVLISTADLSDMASKFAKKLGVIYYKIPMGDYPMIKCNINNGQKIYHLPFDQQYHRTMIKNPGEFWANTVEEAYNAGFRRAMRHII